jgi:hypothetical protein
MGSKGLRQPKDEAPWKEKLSPLRVFGSFSSAEKEQWTNVLQSLISSFVVRCGMKD